MGTSLKRMVRRTAGMLGIAAVVVSCGREAPTAVQQGALERVAADGAARWQGGGGLLGGLLSCTPLPSWGNMIADARDVLATAPWTSVFPGLSITAVVLALHSVADGLKAALDPNAPALSGIVTER